MLSSSRIGAPDRLRDKQVPYHCTPQELARETVPGNKLHNTEQI